LPPAAVTSIPSLPDQPVSVTVESAKREVPAVTVPISEVLETPSTQPESASRPWSLDDWKACLHQWRLKGPELELANQCIRLVHEDSNQIVLAYPSSAMANVTYWGDKLLTAIRLVEPQAHLEWKNEWQTDWTSPEGQVKQLKQAELDAIKADIEQEPRLQKLHQSLGLTPQWAKLEAIAS
jgi:hypothetical protein